MKLSSTRLIEHLESEIESLKAQMREDIIRLQTMHQGELDRALEENQRLRDQCERLTLRVGLPSTMREEPEQPQAPPDPDAMPAFTGTAFERVVARELWFSTPAGKRWQAKQLASVRVSTPEVQKAEETH